MSERIILTFKKAYSIRKRVRYEEEPKQDGGGLALGYIYPHTDVVEAIGSPDRIKVTIEPA